MRPIRPGEVPPKHPYNFPDELPRLAPRKADSHKGDYGRCLIIGGSVGMAGAAALAGVAALRAGAGLVQVAVPRSCLAVVAAHEVSYTTIPLDEDIDGRIASSAVDRLLQAAEKASHFVVGPGLGRSEELNRLVVRLYAEVKLPGVFDADALNALADQPKVLESPGGPRVLTPHPGEFKRLIGGRELKDRVAFHTEARALATKWKATIIVKGYRTFVTEGGRSYINNTGNPGMATGGSGDVLTGVVAGLMCQGLGVYDASRLGTYIHGHAGDAAAEELGQLSLIASDILQFLPNSLRQIIKTG